MPTWRTGRLCGRGGCYSLMRSYNPWLPILKVRGPKNQLPSFPLLNSQERLSLGESFLREFVLAPGWDGAEPRPHTSISFFLETIPEVLVVDLVVELDFGCFNDCA